MTWERVGMWAAMVTCVLGFIGLAGGIIAALGQDSEWED